ncbi:MAG: aminopeptidase [Mycobacteriales bacterium]
MDIDTLDRYAALLLDVGVALRPGQTLAVNAQVEHHPLARALAEAGYRRGAGYVDVWYFDQQVKRSRVAHAPEATLAGNPRWWDTRYEDLGERGDCLVKLHGDPYPGLLDDLPEHRVGLDRSPACASLFRAQMWGLVSWCIAPYPTEGWARAVYGEPDVARLWDEVRGFLRLDADDPVLAWQRHLDRLERRCATLDALDLVGLHLSGEGTDLRLGTIPGAGWKTSTLTNPRGERNLLNMPTEEVYTTPDHRRTEGVVSATRPLNLSGTVVEGLALEFRGGEITGVRARHGADAVRASIAVDDGARRLGEVALVDGTSPIGRSATPTFLDTLLDENATCHLAWGGGIPSVFDDFRERGPEQLAELGVNRSANHIDFMVGGPGVTVTGLTASGDEVTILAGDAWQLAD